MTPPPAAAATPVRSPRRAAKSADATRPAARTGRSAASAAPASPVRRPRRISGPARPASAARSTRSAAAAGSRSRTPARGGALALPLPLPGIRLGLPGGGLLEALAGVTEHRLLDRLIRGRGWIGVVAFALIGIVAMQLWIVKLGVGVGRALEHEAFLQRENAALSVRDARLSAGERVEALAAARGMVAAAPGSVRFDASRGALDARLAAAVLARDEQASPSVTPTTASSGATTTEASSESAGATSTSTSSGAATAEASAGEEPAPGG